MERRRFFTRLGIGAISTLVSVPFLNTALIASNKTKMDALLKKEEIQHMVIFNLHHAKDSEMALKFLHDGQKILSNIPVVVNFQVLNQISPKNDYSYGFSMVFSSKSDYDAYSNHPDHIAFVENRWKKEVSRFLEIDFKSI